MFLYLVLRCRSRICVKGGGASEILPTFRNGVAAAAKIWASKLWWPGGGGTPRSAPDLGLLQYFSMQFSALVTDCIIPSVFVHSEAPDMTGKVVLLSGATYEMISYFNIFLNHLSRVLFLPRRFHLFDRKHGVRSHKVDLLSSDTRLLVTSA